MTYSVNISMINEDLNITKSKTVEIFDGENQAREEMDDAMKRWLHTPSIEDVESDNDEYGNPVIYVTMDCGNVYTIGANMMDKELI